MSLKKTAAHRTRIPCILCPICHYHWCCSPPPPPHPHTKVLNFYSLPQWIVPTWVTAGRTKTHVSCCKRPPAGAQLYKRFKMADDHLDVVSRGQTFFLLLPPKGRGGIGLATRDYLDGTMLLNTIPNRWLKDLKGKLHHSSLDRLKVAIIRFMNVRGEPLYTPVEMRRFRPAKSPVKELCRDLGQKGFNLGTFIEILRDAKLDSYADKLCSHIETARQSTCYLILQQCIESAALQYGCCI